MTNKSHSQILASAEAHPIQQSLQCVRNKGLFIIAYADRFFRITHACYESPDSWSLRIFLFSKESFYLEEWHESKN